MLIRRGTTLAELLVALVLAAVILASAGGTLLRERRLTTAMVTAGAAAFQARAATSLLPAQITLLSIAAPDLVAGEARDTSLQMRTAVATGLACESAPLVTFAAGNDDLPSSGVASAPHAGDSLWWYSADSARWSGQRIVDSWQESLPCAATDPGALRMRPVIRIRRAATDTVPALAPLRVTRQVRIALYRSGDGTWQLGLRDWSDVTGAFATPQPVAGPFLRIAPDGARTGFRYFDAAGIQLFPEADPAAAERIARIRVTALAVPSVLSGMHVALPSRDSADVAIRRRAAP